MSKDIEREAFEKALAGNNIHNLRVCTIFDDEKDEYFASDICDPSEYHIVESINLSWRMWQAAKAQEAEKLKGKAVVPVEPTEHMLNEGYKTYSQVGSLSIVYKSMLEAAGGGK